MVQQQYQTHQMAQTVGQVVVPCTLVPQQILTDHLAHQDKVLEVVIQGSLHIMEAVAEVVLVVQAPTVPIV